MLFTSLAAAVAVAGVAPGVTPTGQPKWQPDYSTAVRTAAAQHKPLAVFVGHGQAGFAQLVTDGGPAAPTTQTLGEKFVSVYIDADSPAGKPLAEALKVTDGLVISDHTGTVAALRHQGTVAPAALSTYLTTYAVEQPVVQTVQAGTLAPVYAAPVYAPAPMYAPAYGGVVMGGNCANGQCGVRPLATVFNQVMGGGCANGQCGRPTMFR